MEDANQTQEQLLTEIALLRQREQEINRRLEQEQAARLEADQLLQATNEQLANIYEILPDALIRVDTEWCYTFVNHHAEELLGKSRSELMGKSAWEVFPSLVETQAYQLCQQAMAEQVMIEYEEFYPEFNKWFAVRLSPLPTGLTTYFRDITQYKQAEEALRQSEERFAKAFLVNPAATAITTIAQGRYIDVNDSFLELLGFERQEVIGKTSVELGLWVDAKDRPQVMQQFLQRLRQQPIHNLEIQFRNKSGEIREGLTSVVLIDLGSELCMLTQLRDVTDQKRTEAALKYRLDFEALLTSISTQFINLEAAVLDQGIHQALQQIGEFAQVDRVCAFLIHDERFFNTHQWYAEGIPPLLYPPEGLPVDTLPSTIAQLRQFKTIHVPVVEDLPEPRKSISQSFGVKSYIAVPIVYKGELIGSLAFNSILVHKTWSDEDVTLLRTLADIFASALMRKRAEEALQQAHEELEARVAQRTIELQRANEQLRSEMIERQQAETALKASEEKFRSLSACSPVGIFLADIGGRCIYTNPRCQAICGFSYEESLEREWIKCIHPDDRKQIFADWATHALSGEEYSHELRIQQEGIVRWVHVRSSPMFSSQGELVGHVGTVEDITDRRTVEMQLRTSLQEKEVLLKEIHHRVKNNLQMVSSLLNLQASFIQDPDVLTPFRESQQRVRAMALIHEKLYQTESLASVRFDEYVRNLVADLLRSFSPHPGTIKTRFEIDEVELEIDKVIPCALIINELVSNSIKYAFPNRIGGEIAIYFSATASKEYNLVIQDNGIGFPKELDFRNTHSLGLQLVCSLTEQLQGTIELNRSNGTAFLIHLRGNE
jgi:PAS domain S-box-containing protein